MNAPLITKGAGGAVLDRRPIMCKTGSNSFSLSLSPGLDLARSLSSRIIIITC